MSLVITKWSIVTNLLLYTMKINDFTIFHKDSMPDLGQFNSDNFTKYYLINILLVTINNHLIYLVNFFINVRMFSFNTTRR